jgi:hypothetical protein
LKTLLVCWRLKALVPLEIDMPRDSSGNYSLPLGNPVIDGTIIETTWANPTMSDIATQLNNVLTRDGLLGPTVAPFKILAGTLPVPGLAFNDALTTGLYKTASYVGFSWNAALIFAYDADTVDFYAQPTFTGVPAFNQDITNKLYVDQAISAALTGGIPGTVALNPVDITASRALVAADFGTGIVRINSASVVAITLPTVATMALAATPGKVRTMAFQIEGAGIPTFAGATGSTTINGIAGPTVSAPVSGAPVRYQYVVLTQRAVGSNDWTLN